MFFGLLCLIRHAFYVETIFIHNRICNIFKVQQSQLT